MAKGNLFVYTGASGVGKGTIMKRLLKAKKDLKLSVSATTREPRPSEINAVDYYFVSKSKFEEMIENDGLLEYASYCGNYYGTPKKPVLDNLEKGFDVILEIEVNGFLQVKKRYPECITIFIMPPSLEELENRLVGRGTETADVIKSRLETAKKEITFADQFDYIVYNDDIDRATNEVIDIISDKKNNN